MQYVIPWTVVVVMVASTAMAQPNPKSTTSKPLSYSLTFTEMQLKSDTDVKSIATATDPVAILNRLDAEGKVDLVLRLLADKFS